MLENINEESLHIGKRPLRSPTQTADLSRLIQLRNQQREAVDREDYEAAAALRDRILEIEASLRPASET